MKQIAITLVALTASASAHAAPAVEIRDNQDQVIFAVGDDAYVCGPVKVLTARGEVVFEAVSGSCLDARRQSGR